MKKLFKYTIFLFIVLFLLFPTKSFATIYTRSSGVVTITAPKSKSYQWYIKKNKRWKKIKGENRRSLTLLCNKRQNGYRYRCRLKNKWSKTEKIVITDIGKRYQRNINIKDAKGLFMPKCADGYCYVHCTNKKLAEKTKGAIKILNNQIGLTFIYTDSPHIADIIIQKWSDKKLNDSIWLRDDEIDQIRNNGEFWAGVAFSIQGLHYLICINWGYVCNNDTYCKSVIMHELGHCIGIGHSDDVRSIMYPSCMGVIKLTPSDILDFKKQREKIRSL